MPATIRFSGSAQAERFTREIAESFAGVLKHNYVGEGECVGFIRASREGKGWGDTMWSRDGGTFMRELVHYGAFAEAKRVFDALLGSVDLNELGYYTFPEHVRMGEKISGKEADGTAGVIVASLLLAERLPEEDEYRDRIVKFLTAPESPLRYFMRVLEKQPFIEGSGEFGAGCYLDGTVFNVVQNAMTVFALDMVAERLPDWGEETPRFKRECGQAARLLEERMVQRFVNGSGGWHWCLRIEDATPHEEFIREPINRGTTLMNGVLSHSSDVYGALPNESKKPWLFPAVQTFWQLTARPKRLGQLVRHGIYTQFDEFFYGGLGTSPAYGHGYALQCMLLMDLPDLYSKAADFLADVTVEPGYAIDRESPYWFSERYYSPDVHGNDDLEEGCGALNLVNVSEPLKAARLMAGLDDGAADDVRIVPRLPVGWTGVSAVDVPVRAAGGCSWLRFEAEADEAGAIARVRGECSAPLPSVRVRLGTAELPRWVRFENAARFDTGE